MLRSCLRHQNHSPQNTFLSLEAGVVQSLISTIEIDGGRICLFVCLDRSFYMYFYFIIHRLPRTTSERFHAFHSKIKISGLCSTYFFAFQRRDGIIITQQELFCFMLIESTHSFCFCFGLVSRFSFFLFLMEISL
jgi:hypothetical protein